MHSGGTNCVQVQLWNKRVRLPPAMTSDGLLPPRLYLVGYVRSEAPSNHSSLSDNHIQQLTDRTLPIVCRISACSAGDQDRRIDFLSVSKKIPCPRVFFPPVCIVCPASELHSHSQADRSFFSFAHCARLRVDAAPPRLARAFRMAPVSRQTKPNAVGTHRALTRVLPP